MNYNNVKNPFDIYEQENKQESENENNSVEEEKRNVNNKGNIIFLTITYVLIIFMALIGVISLVLPNVRAEFFTTLF